MASLKMKPIGESRKQLTENELESSSQTSLASITKSLKTTGSSNLQPLKASSTNIQYNTNNYRHDDDEFRLTLHYDSMRSKQQRLLLFMNIFRLLVIFIIAPLMYFVV